MLALFCVPRPSLPFHVSLHLSILSHSSVVSRATYPTVWYIGPNPFLSLRYADALFEIQFLPLFEARLRHGG